MSRAIVCAGAGGAFALTLNAGMDAGLVNPAETNARVSRCASVLGETVIQADAIPEECSDFTIAFNSKIIRVSTLDPLTNRRSVNEHKEYTWPSSGEFKRDFGASDTVVESYKDSKRANSGISKFMGGLAFAAFYSLPWVLNRHDKKNAHPPRSLARQLR